MLLPLGFLVLLIASLNSVSLVARAASGQVRVLNDQGTVDESGAYHILGEIENPGDTPITSVNMTAIGYGQLDEVLATSSTYTDLTVILPNEKSPFDVVLTYYLTEHDVYNYSLSIAYSAAKLDTSNAKDPLKQFLY